MIPLALRLPLLLAAASGAPLGLSALAARAPAPPAEAWVYARTEKGEWAFRVDGGPPKQVASKLTRRGPGEKWAVVKDEGGGYRTSGLVVDGGKRVVFSEEDPQLRAKAKARADVGHRLLIGDARGDNPVQVLTGLKWNQGFRLAADGKSVVCGAEQDGKWDVYRVPFDGTPPVKLSRTPGIDHPAFRELPDSRVVYRAVTGWHVEQVQFGTWTTGKGPVLLTDSKTETVLVKETNGGLPEVTDDATKMAVSGKNDKGKDVIEVTDLKTGKVEEFPLSAFNKDWTCRFRNLRFSPDGKALAVTFFLGNVVIREKGPLPGDEAVQHFGVIWLDGRKDRTALFKVDQPLQEHGYFPEIRVLEWSPPPAVK